eukprot:403337460
MAYFGLQTQQRFPNQKTEWSPGPGQYDQTSNSQFNTLQQTHNPLLHNASAMNSTLNKLFEKRPSMMPGAIIGRKSDCTSLACSKSHTNVLINRVHQHSPHKKEMMIEMGVDANMLCTNHQTTRNISTHNYTLNGDVLLKNNSTNRMNHLGPGTYEVQQRTASQSFNIRSSDAFQILYSEQRKNSALRQNSATRERSTSLQNANLRGQQNQNSSSYEKTKQLLLILSNKHSKQQSSDKKLTFGIKNLANQQLMTPNTKGSSFNFQTSGSKIPMSQRNDGIQVSQFSKTSMKPPLNKFKKEQYTNFESNEFPFNLDNQNENLRRTVIVQSQPLFNSNQDQFVNQRVNQLQYQQAQNQNHYQSQRSTPEIAIENNSQLYVKTRKTGYNNSFVDSRKMKQSYSKISTMMNTTARKNHLTNNKTSAQMSVNSSKQNYANNNNYSRNEQVSHFQVNQDQINNPMQQKQYSFNQIQNQSQVPIVNLDYSYVKSGSGHQSLQKTFAQTFEVNSGTNSRPSPMSYQIDLRQRQHQQHDHFNEQIMHSKSPKKVNQYDEDEIDPYEEFESVEKRMKTTDIKQINYLIDGSKLNPNYENIQDAQRMIHDNDEGESVKDYDNESHFNDQEDDNYKHQKRVNNNLGYIYDMQDLDSKASSIKAGSGIRVDKNTIFNCNYQNNNELENYQSNVSINSQNSYLTGRRVNNLQSMPPRSACYCDSSCV